MSDLNQSPKQDELSRGNDDYHTTIPLAAVEAMYKDKYMRRLVSYVGDWRGAIEELFHELWTSANIMIPDWIFAARNCQDDDMILPIAIHTFLLDWKPQ